jgi:hypothetical protein
VTKLVRPQLLAPGLVDVRMIAQAVEDAANVPAVLASDALRGLGADRPKGLTPQGQTQLKLRHERLCLCYFQARNAAAEAQDALGKATRFLNSLGEQNPGRLAAASFPLQAREALGITAPAATRARGSSAEKGPRLAPS